MTPVQFPDKLKFLFQPYRYKCAYGGRGSGKSWSFARALLIQAAQKPLRVLCAREVQKSIRDSVKKLLDDQINTLGLSEFYESLEAIIRGKNGTEFLFSGLSTLTASSLKSYEGIDVVWLEEAQVISKSSWDILVPTIRKEGSEIWVSMNPMLETDETYRRMVVNPPPGTMTVFTNYYDNPWFPEVLEQERAHCQATESAEDYNNLWEGHCRSAVSGAIYAQEVAAATAAGRICNLPYEPGLKVHVVCDMGFGDNMVGVFAQKIRSEVRVIDYIQVRQHRTDEFGVLIREKRYNFGHVFLPHDGFHVTRGTGLSDQDILKRMGFSIRQVPNIPKEDGIRALRNVFPQIYFDRVKCEMFLECLKRYRRAETKSGGDGNPVHDEYSDGADAARYMALCLQSMTNEDEKAMPVINAWQPLSSEMGY